MMTNALTTRQQAALVPQQSLAQLKEVAAMVIKSGLAPRGMTTEQLAIIYLKGQEMGMRPMEAQESFYVVNGSVGNYTHQLVSRLRQFGHDYVINESTMEQCTITIYRRDGGEYQHTLTFKECAEAGYNKDSKGIKFTWRGAGQRWMLAYRTISSGIKLYCPEVLHGEPEEVAPRGPDSGPVHGTGRGEEAWYSYTMYLLENEGLEATIGLIKALANDPDAYDPRGEVGASVEDLAQGMGQAGPEEDVLDAEYTEQDDDPDPDPQPQYTRPYAPAEVRKAVQQRVDRYPDAKAENGLRGAAVGAIEALFLGQNKHAKTIMRHQVGEYLFGKASSMDWTQGECQAVLDWAQSEDDTGKVPSMYASQEAIGIVTAMDVAQGQQELPLS